MTKVVPVLVTLVALSACGFKYVQPEVSYDVTTYSQHESAVKSSKVPHEFSDYQIQELCSKLGSKKYLSLFKLVVLYDITQEQLKSVEIPEQYSGAKFICSDQLPEGNILIVEPDTSDEDIIEGLKTCDGIRLSSSTTVVPVCCRLRDFAEEVPYKFEFIASLKELLPSE